MDRTQSRSRKPAHLTQFFGTLTLVLFIVAFPYSAQAQPWGTASHTVTVNVSPISVLAVSSGSVGLTISGAGAVAGQNQMTVVDQSTSLLWGVNTTPKKITVVSSLAAPKFTTKLLATNQTTGTPAAQLTLNSIAADLLLNIGKSKGSCSLQYTGIALASQGMGSDNHILTFTITVQ